MFLRQIYRLSLFNIIKYRGIMGIKIYVFFIPMVLFYSCKYLKMGIHGNGNSFFTWDFKVCLRIFLWFLRFCLKGLHNTLLLSSSLSYLFLISIVSWRRVLSGQIFDVVHFSYQLYKISFRKWYFPW